MTSLETRMKKVQGTFVPWWFELGLLFIVALGCYGTIFQDSSRVVENKPWVLVCLGVFVSWPVAITYVVRRNVLGELKRWREEDDAWLAEVLSGRGKAAADYLREFLKRPCEKRYAHDLILDHVWPGLEYLASEVDRVGTEIIQAQIQDREKAERRNEEEEKAFREDHQERYSEAHTAFWSTRDSLAAMTLSPVTRELVDTIKSWKDALPSKYPTKSARVMPSR